MKTLPFLFLMLLAACASPDADHAAGAQLDWKPEFSALKDQMDVWESEAATQFEMNRFAFAELEILDAELYITMTHYAQVCTTRNRQQLYSQHESWLERRSIVGEEASAPHAGGSIAPLIAAVEMGTFTQTRIEQFNALMDSGDTNCDVPILEVPALQLSNDGFLGIGSEIAFDLDGIAARLPWLMLEPTIMEDEGGQWNALEMSYSMSRVGRINATMDGNQVFSIELNGDPVVGPAGETWIDTLGSLGQNNFDCVPGMESWSGSIMCTSIERPNIVYEFVPDAWDGPDGEFPPDSVMATARINSYIWINPTI